MDEQEQMEIAKKVLCCIEYCKQRMEQGETIEGVEYKDIEDLIIAVETVMM